MEISREELNELIDDKRKEIHAYRMQAAIIKELELYPLIWAWQNYPEPYKDYHERNREKKEEIAGDVIESLEKLRDHLRGKTEKIIIRKNRELSQKQLTEKYQRMEKEIRITKIGFD